MWRALLCVIWSCCVIFSLPYLTFSRVAELYNLAESDGSHQHVFLPHNNYTFQARLLDYPHRQNDMVLCF